MSRKGSAPQREILPDPKHGSQTIARFINMVMLSGKKSVAEKIVYGAMDVIGEKNSDALGLVEKALGNVAPAVEGRGGAMKTRDEVHRMAEANKAFSHFRFGAEGAHKATARPDLAPAMLAVRPYGCASRSDLAPLATLFAPLLAH